MTLLFATLFMGMLTQYLWERLRYHIHEVQDVRLVHFVAPPVATLVTLDLLRQLFFG